MPAKIVEKARPNRRVSMLDAAVGEWYRDQFGSLVLCVWFSRGTRPVFVCAKDGNEIEYSECCLLTPVSVTIEVVG